MRKIKLIHTIYSLNMGGAETIVKDYSLNFNKNVFDFTLICIKRMNTPYESILEQHGVNVIFISDYNKLSSTSIFQRFFSYFLNRFYFIKFIKEIKPDIIHMHLGFADYVYHLNLRDIKLFYTQHYDIERLINETSGIYTSLKRLLLKKDITFIALHDKMAEQIKSLFKTENVLIVNNGINIKNFQKSINIDKKKEEINIPNDRTVIGHIGRFHKVKNHDYLLSVFNECIKGGINGHLLLIGKGEEEIRIKSIIDNLNLSQRVTILHDREDVNELLKVMDVIVFPSFSEGLPVTLIEAQISGTPVIASDVIDTRVRISNIIKFKSINIDPIEWYYEINNMLKCKINLKFYNIESWDILNSTRKLEQLYKKRLGAY